MLYCELVTKRAPTEVGIDWNIPKTDAVLILICTVSSNGYWWYLIRGRVMKSGEEELKIVSEELQKEVIKLIKATC